MNIKRYLLIYNIKKQKKKKKELIIFGEEFIKNNKNKMKISINNKKVTLTSFLSPKKFKSIDNNIKINLILNKYISNTGYMFKNCSTLTEIKSFNDIYSEEDKKFIDKYTSYFGQKELNLNDFEDYDLNDDIYGEINENNCNNNSNNEEDMNLFNENLEEEIHNNCWDSKDEIINKYCSPIKYDKKIYNKIRSNNSTYNDDIGTFELEINNSPFKTKQSIINSNINSYPNSSFNSIIKNLFCEENKNSKIISCAKDMFYECSSLKSLPDISYWNTNDLFDLSSMFYKCSSLISLPDISKWNTKNVYNKYIYLMVVNH